MKTCAGCLFGRDPAHPNAPPPADPCEACLLWCSCAKSSNFMKRVLPDMSCERWRPAEIRKPAVKQRIIQAVIRLLERMVSNGE